MIGKEPFTGWVIGQKLGHGGYGNVYLATKDGFSSAVKQIIIPNNEVYTTALERLGGNEEAVLNYYKPEVERLRKEIEIMRRLSGILGIITYHDHIIRKYDKRVGWEILIRMEFLLSFNRYVNECGITMRQILELGVELCSALQACFQENILHRDIKESNIMLDIRGNFKLVDFGVSKNIEGTSVATVIGTFGYMAPEIARNESYDHRADIYSLGIVMYKLLNSGLMPFMPEDGTILDDKKSRALMLSGKQFPKPRYGNEEVITAISKACSYNKEDRYSTFEEMGKTFKELLLKTDSTLLNRYTIEVNSSKISDTKTYIDRFIGGFNFDTTAPLDIDGTVSVFNNIKNEKAKSKFKKAACICLATVLVTAIAVILFVLRKDVANAFSDVEKNMPISSVSIANSTSTTPNPLPSGSALSSTLTPKTTNTANATNTTNATNANLPVVTSKNTVKPSLPPNQNPLTNLIINPNIESTSNWLTDSRDNSTGTGSFTTEDKYNGNQCLKVIKTNNIGVQYHYQSMPNPTGGGSFTYSAFVKTKNLSSNGSLIWIYYSDSAGNGIKIFSNSISGTANWQKITLNFTLSSEIKSFDALVGSKGTGTAYFDNITLYRN